MISINILYGAAECDADDIDRAKAAALAVLDSKGFAPATAYAAFQAEWAYLETDAAIDAGLCQDYDCLRDEQSVAWVEAERAADIALTEGWARPDGASCSIAA